MGPLGESNTVLLHCDVPESCQACFTLYERLVEPIVSIFIPFYDQIKSLYVVFFIVTRAKVS